MGFFKKLFGSGSEATGSAFDGVTYTNSEWNFSLTIPRDWEVIFENEIQGFPWTQPVRLGGPQGAHARPYVTVVTQIVDDDGMGLGAYMKKAESDLAGNFENFKLLKKKERTHLGWPSAWMTYTYQGNNGVAKELNVTTFYGNGKMMWFQFICESDTRQAKSDFAVFEQIIDSVEFGAAGIRHPLVQLTGAPTCGLCGKVFPEDTKPNAMVNLKLGRLIGVCDDCRNG